MSWNRSPGFDPAGHRGLTLLEVVVATAIFSVTVVSLLIVRDRAIVQTATAKNYRTARRLAMQILEEIHGGKDYEAGMGEPFDERQYPGFSWRIKEVEVVELEEPELEFLKDPGRKPGQPKERKSGSEPGGGPGGLPAGGLAEEELKRYVVEVTYPARHEEEGSATLEVTTYYLKEGDPEALAKMLGGGAGGGAGGLPAGDAGGVRMPGGMTGAPGR